MDISAHCCKGRLLNIAVIATSRLVVQGRVMTAAIQRTAKAHTVQTAGKGWGIYSSVNAKEVEYAVARMFGTRQNLIVPNVSWGFSGLRYEADMVVVNKTGYAKEIEIKVSKADLIKDGNKKHSHDCRKFKELYFAIPEILLQHRENIPKKAGIIVIKEGKNYNNEKYLYAEIERNPERNSAERLTQQEKYELARLGTLRIWNLKRKLLAMKRN